MGGVGIGLTEGRGNGVGTGVGDAVGLGFGVVVTRGEEYTDAEQPMATNPATSRLDRRGFFMEGRFFIYRTFPMIH